MSILNPLDISPLAEEVSIRALQTDEYLYETGEYHRCWWEFLASKFDIPYKDGDLLIHRRRVFRNLLPLRELRIAGWNNAWSQDLTAERVARFEEIDKAAGWDYFRMTWVESRRAHQAIQSLKEQGYLVHEAPAPQQYVIDLGGGMEGYLQSLSHNGRKGLKKKVRRAQDLSPALLPCETEADIDAFFEEFFRHHIAYWDEKAGRSYFNDAEERNFIIHWAKMARQKGELRMDRLTLGGETVNLSMGIVSGDTFYWLLTINTGLHADYGPGLVGLYLQLEEAAAAGLTRFNMGAGDYFYKVQSANSRDFCHEIIACNPRSLKGHIYYQWLKRQPIRSTDPA